MPRIKRIAQRRKGAILVFAAIMIVFIVAMIALSVDVGMIVLERTEMQHAVDAASMAAASVLADGGNQAEVEAAARQYLQANGVDPNSLAPDQLAIELGSWDFDSKVFTATNFDEATAVRVFSRVADRPLFFAPIVGHDTFNSGAESIAATSIGKPQDVMMVIDCSSSMNANNRMTYTIAAAQVLLSELKADDRLGLAVYSWKDPDDGGRLTGHLETNLNFDHAPTATMVPTLRPGLYTSRTCIAGGMRVAIEEFQANPRSDPAEKYAKVMVVLTDGRANVTEPPGTDPFNSIDHYAGVAKAENITIHSITLGNSASEVAMRNAATTTDGTYHHIEDNDYSALQSLFRQIGKGIGRPRLVY